MSAQPSLFNTREAKVVFSPDRRFRYLLTRRWSDDGPMVAWIMCNPSLADEQHNDNTVERCVRRIMRRPQFGGMYVVNLFAFITPYPWELRAEQARGGDIVGPDNDAFITMAATSSKLVIAAWGAESSIGDRGRAVFDRCMSVGIQLKCLGLTRDRAPRHPLYVPYEQDFEDYAP